ncbi:MAG: TrkA family potassium uptake protein [Bacteroidales bacterium]|jgi:trk system potassium uptake protein TrkA|nr:TrkA family potassium uptake protein [Bacteroidales bacterium]MBR3579340.1 TrkA family potassium uptake protein [Bacteroidales bacterium]MBR4488106.1 TrkA family potassium uptake protein [Bacteroidales bacterium]
MSNERFAIIGAGHFGSSIAIALSQSGAEVLVIDSDINVIQDISDDVAYAVCIDATNKKALIAENIQDFDVVVVAIGNDFVKRLLCTANLMDLNVKRIICRTMGKNQRIILEKMGVTEFLSPEDEIGTLFAERLLNPSVVSYLQLPDGYRIAEIIAPQRLIGMTIADLNLRDAYRLSLITIRRNFADSPTPTQSNATGHTLGVPDTSTVIEEKDCFVIFGLTRDIENFIKKNQ